MNTFQRPNFSFCNLCTANFTAFIQWFQVLHIFCKWSFVLFVLFPYTQTGILEKMWGRRCEIGVLTFFLVFTSETSAFLTV